MVVQLQRLLLRLPGTELKISTRIKQVTPILLTHRLSLRLKDSFLLGSSMFQHPLSYSCNQNHGWNLRDFYDIYDCVYVVLAIGRETLLYSLLLLRLFFGKLISYTLLAALLRSLNLPRSQRYSTRCLLLQPLTQCRVDPHSIFLNHADLTPNLQWI